MLPIVVNMLWVAQMRLLFALALFALLTTPARCADLVTAGAFIQIFNSTRLDQSGGALASHCFSLEFVLDCFATTQPRGT